MNVIFTCGATGGHINPAVAVANIWKERYPDCKILFMGGGTKLERELVTKAGYDFVGWTSRAVTRGKSLKVLKENVKTVFSTVKGISKCKKIIKDFKPSVIVGTGGYASFQMLMAGHLMGVPTCVHEANAMPGMTTRMIAPYADRVLVCFPESRNYYKNKDKVEVVGMPVRREFIFTQKKAAREQLGLDERPVIVSAFGSQGAHAMNEVVAELFKLEQDAGFPYQHIHAVGTYGWEWMPEYVKNKGVDLENAPAIQMKEYIYDMPTVMAAADVVISRAGASSCNEIAASGTPSVLIPSPNVTDNHQEKNARALERSGGAVVILEKDCTAKLIKEHIDRMTEDKDRYEQMGKALFSMVTPDSAEQVCRIMEELIKGSK